MARDDAHFNSQFHVVAGYLSPVNDRYAKLGLASADHRVEMCRLATTETSEWLMVDPWEARQPRYLPTAQVLDHFDHEINQVRGGVECEVRDPGTGHVRIEKKRCRIMLLAGSDLILTMSEPGVWAEKDVRFSLSPAFWAACGRISNSVLTRRDLARAPNAAPPHSRDLRVLHH